MRSVVVTGVSTGIGHAATEVLLARGFRVFGSVRSQETADRLQASLGENFAPLIFDVTDGEAIREARIRLSTEMPRLYDVIHSLDDSSFCVTNLSSSAEG